MKPHRCRTWAPRGKTPILQYRFNWKTLSAIAGVTWWTFYFRLYPGAIKSPQVVDFLTRLQRQLPGKLLIVWDGLRQHRSRLVMCFNKSSVGLSAQCRSSKTKRIGDTVLALASSDATASKRR